MPFAIYAFGHGGGVAGPIPNTPVKAAGNTNFAIIPNLTIDAAQWVKDGRSIKDLLGTHEYYLIDCGPETALTLCGVIGGHAPVAKNCKGIFLTHTHDDHSGGLKTLAYRFKYVEGTKPFLMVPEDAMYELIRAQTAELTYLNPTVSDKERTLGAYYDLKVQSEYTVLDEDGQVLFRMDAFPVDHNCFDDHGRPFPAVGYFLSFADGRRLVFSGDTAKVTGLGTLAQDKTIAVIHDVQFYAPHDPMAFCQKYVHCPYSLLRDAVPPDLRHKVLLTHTSHDLPPEAEADGFRLLQGGMLLVVG